LGNTDSRIHSSAIIEGTTKLGAETIVEPHTSLFGPIRTGKQCFIGTGSRLHGPLEIGDNAFIGEFVSIGFPTQPRIIAFQTGMTRHPYVKSKPTVLGDNCIIRTGTVIYANVKLGNHVRTGHHAIIREEVTIGDHSLIGTGAIIDGKTSVGSKVSIQSRAYIPWKTTIEDHVFLGPNCILTNDKYVMRTPFELEGPTIRRGASVGAGAIIMPGVEVGEEAVIGAGAVVTRDVPPKTIVFGVPARTRNKIPREWKIPMK
jgi:acetyltransferase-like isoleucine patch superfamily enzyme